MTGQNPGTVWKILTVKQWLLDGLYQSHLIVAVYSSTAVWLNHLCRVPGVGRQISRIGKVPMTYLLIIDKKQSPLPLRLFKKLVPYVCPGSLFLIPMPPERRRNSVGPATRSGKGHPFKTVTQPVQPLQVQITEVSEIENEPKSVTFGEFRCHCLEINDPTDLLQITHISNSL